MNVECLRTLKLTELHEGSCANKGYAWSGCGESRSLIGERVNAVLRLCRGLGTAQSFFKSEDSLVSLPLAWMAWALALEVDDKDFRQSFAEWPGPPQNMHKLLLKWCCLSCGVNFLSLPSLSAMDVEFPEED